MRDTMDERLDRLFAEARSHRPDTADRELNFETRVMARIRERRAAAVPWYSLVWRMIPAFAVIAAIIAVCSASFNPARSQDLFAAITNVQDDYMATSLLTGE
jgi:type VI protein secretion system component VasF